MKINGPAGQPKELTRGLDDLKKNRGAEGIERAKDLGEKSPIKIGGSAPEKVELSAKGRDIDKAKRIADAAPEINEDKVARLKKAIAEGTYKVDDSAIADRLVDEQLKTSVL